MPNSPARASADALLFHHYLVDAARSSPGAEAVGPFVAMFDADDDNPYRNYAVPIPGADPGDVDIAALARAFERRQRRPRLEFVADACPRTPPVLQARGFRVEGLMPLLVATGAPVPADPPGATFGLARSREDFLGVAETQAEAFAAPLAAEADIRRLAATIEAGGLIAFLRDRTSGEIAAVAQYGPPRDGITEIAGVATRARYRRRGLAAAVTARLAGEAAARGITRTYVMAQHADGARVYERAGFGSAGDILHISKPA